MNESIDRNVVALITILLLALILMVQLFIKTCKDNKIKLSEVIFIIFLYTVFISGIGVLIYIIAHCIN